MYPKIAAAHLPLLVCFIWSAVLNAAYAQDVPPQKLDVLTAEKLDARLRDRGVAHVIVGIRSSDEPLANLQTRELRTSAVRAARRAAIARLQERVLRAIQNPRAVKRFKHFSSIALEVDANALDRLLQLDEVATIREDEPLRPTLDYSVPQIGADLAWSSGYTGSGQAVAVLDVGVDSTHPSLAGKTIAEACFSTTNSIASSLCPNGENPGGVDQQFGSGAGMHCDEQDVPVCDHGTHVAGIATGSDSSYTGVASDADLIPIQVFSRFDDSSSCSGSPPCVLAYFSDVLRALEWVYDQRDLFTIASVNMSLGGGSYQTSAACDAAFPQLNSAVDNLRTVDIATVVSSGNSGFTNAISTPACVSGAISVGASTASDGVANFSNSASWLSVLAPGTSIRSAVPGTGFANKSGTSMAAPHMAGTIASLRSAEPNASVDEIMEAITNTGIRITDSRNGVTVPRVRVDAAADALVAGSGEGGQPAMLTPTPGTPLSGVSESFSWTAHGAPVTEWWIYIGSSIGARDIYESGSLGASLSTTIDGLPTDGSLLYLRLWFRIAGSWQSVDYQYTAADTGEGGQPAMLTPTPGTPLSGASESFSWTANGAPVTKWWIYIGSSVGARDIYESGSLGTSLSTTIDGLPTDGSLLYLRLWFRIAGSWQSVDYQYTAAN